jgi:hypothetical protein
MTSANLWSGHITLGINAGPGVEKQNPRYRLGKPDRRMRFVILSTQVFAVCSACVCPDHAKGACRWKLDIQSLQENAQAGRLRRRVSGQATQHQVYVALPSSSTALLMVLFLTANQK